jgi:hypothetical protein
MVAIGICRVMFRTGLEEADEFLSVPRLPGQLFHVSRVYRPRCGEYVCVHLR